MGPTKEVSQRLPKGTSRLLRGGVVLSLSQDQSDLTFIYFIYWKLL